MSDKKEEIKLKRITIKTEIGTKWFDEPEKLLTWVQAQQRLYAFHVNISQRYQLQQLFSKFDISWQNLQQQISQGLLRFKHDPDNYNNRVEQFSKSFADLLAKQELFTEEASFNEFVQAQAKNRNEYGLAALAVAFDQNISPIDRTMYKGLHEAEAYFAGNAERVSDESESLQQLHDRWDNELTHHRDSWQLNYQEKIDEATIQNEQVDDLINEWKEQINKHADELESHKDKFNSKFDDELSNAKSELENLTKTYDDKLALHAAVKYWNLQRQSHTKKAIIFSIALGIMTIVVICTIVAFSYLTLDAPLKEIHLSKIFTAAALTTFGIWLIKILANIFMSHLHLSTDAQERRTMIHTYLALTRKGQGPKEEDRQLILQTLFRPSATDLVKNDQGPTQLVDMINRLSPKSR